MMIKERNKAIKKILVAEFGNKAVSVTGARGTAYGWVDIAISVKDPCPFKQNTDSCNYYCKDGICKGNENLIYGGWGNTVRQLEDKTTRDRVKALLADIEFDTFIGDDGYNTEHNCVNIHVNSV